jgi:hypothetical protein
MIEVGWPEKNPKYKPYQEPTLEDRIKTLERKVKVLERAML